MSVNVGLGNIDQTTPINSFTTLSEMTIDQYLLGINNIVQGDGAKITYGNLIKNALSADTDNILDLGSDGKLTVKAGLLGGADGWAQAPNLSVNWTNNTVTGLNGIFYNDGLVVSALSNFTSPEFTFEGTLNTVQYLYYNSSTETFSWSIDPYLGDKDEYYPICSIAQIETSSGPSGAGLPSSPSNPTESTTPSVTKPSSPSNSVTPVTPSTTTNASAISAMALNDTPSAQADTDLKPSLTAIQTWGLSGTEKAVVSYLDGAIGMVVTRGGDITNVELKDATQNKPLVSDTIISTATFSQTVPAMLNSSYYQVAFYDQAIDSKLKLIYGYSEMVPNSLGNIFYASSTGLKQVDSQYYMNVWLVAIPFLGANNGQGSGFIWVAGEKEYQDLEDAQKASFEESYTYNALKELFSRFVPMYRFTLQAQTNSFFIVDYAKTAEGSATGGGGGGGTTVVSPKVGTIFCSPFPIDESDGTQAGLRGQQIIPNAGNQAFFNWLKTYGTQYPDRIETDYQTWASDLATNGFNDKFFVGSTWGNIGWPDLMIERDGYPRLPSFAEGFAYQIDSPGEKLYPTAGNGKTLNLTNNAQWFGMRIQTETLRLQPAVSVYNDPIGTTSPTTDGSFTRYTAVGVVPDFAASSLHTKVNGDDFIPSNIKCYWGIQVATNVLEENNIINDYELANPFFYGMSLYSETAPQTPGWLKAGVYVPQSAYLDLVSWITGQLDAGALNFKGNTGYAYKTTDSSSSQIFYVATPTPSAGATVYQYFYDDFSMTTRIAIPMGTVTNTTDTGIAWSRYEQTSTANLERSEADDLIFGTNEGWITDMDFHLNSTDSTFRLPLKNGKENILSTDNPIRLKLTAENKNGLFARGERGAIFLSNSSTSSALGFISIDTYDSPLSVTAIYDPNLPNASSGEWLLDCPPYLWWQASASNSFGWRSTQDYATYYPYVGKGDLYWYVGAVVSNVQIINMAKMQEWMVNNQLAAETTWGDYTLNQTQHILYSWDAPSGTSGYTSSVLELNFSSELPNDGYSYRVVIDAEVTINPSQLPAWLSVYFYPRQQSSFYYRWEHQPYSTNLLQAFNSYIEWLVPPSRLVYFGYYLNSTSTAYNSAALKVSCKSYNRIPNE